MRMIHPAVDGRPMASIGPWFDVEYVNEWLHGCTTASWSTTPGVTHSALRQGAPVTLLDAGWPVWKGTLTEPGSDGQLHAIGLWAQGQNVAAIDADGNATSIPDVAIDAAINRGAVSWRRPVSLSTTAVITNNDAPADLMLADLLDKWAEGVGKRWGVDGRGEVYASGHPASSSWMVVPGFAPLTPADDEFVTALIGEYSTGADTSSTVRVDDPLAQQQFGVRERVVDLTDRGIIDSAAATTILQAMLDAGASRMGWAQAIEVAPGQLTTLGGTPGMSVTPGEGVKIVGAYDPSWTAVPDNYTDITADKVTRRADGTVLIEPAGLVARTLASVLGQALS